MREVYPRAPHSPADIPEGALEALGAACGVEGLHQTFILPSSVRSVGRKDHKVLTPQSVLAVGARAIGLWTSLPRPGVKLCIPLEKLAAIEDVAILLYGRLSFLSFGTRLTIRYNMLARKGLEPTLLDLRRRVAGPPRPVPREEEACAELPYKWKQMLASAPARLERNASVVFRFARVRDEVDRGQLLVLNPHELVFMCDPVGASHQYGEDSLIVPRCRGLVVKARDRSVEVFSNGAHFSLPMAQPLCAAAARWFARNAS